MRLIAAIPDRLRRTGGFTLAELLVAMLMGLGLAATVVWFNRLQFHAMEDQARQLTVQSATRAIAELFAREVRRAGLDPTCAGLFQPLVEADATQLHFQADLDGNGALDAASEDLRYRFDADSGVARLAGGVAETLLDEVDLLGSRLRYFDGAGGELVPAPSLSAAQRAQVRRVRLELAVRTAAASPSRDQPLVARIATDVELRNRFFLGTAACS